ncbi:MAG TPA: DHHA1 domain-containing protein [Vicinamibacterales bacterium]|nr:DHHA1 domain-containing protein [Vicinamibacterales bacterium]
MTQRIYYSEPYRQTFDATIQTVDIVDGHQHVTLDQTAFYPTSGGQPFDTGTLGGAAVTDVIDREDGTIAHVVSGSVRAGDIVTGEIDWARRFDHMQQHTGQHVLSAAFDRLFSVRTESFHMGQVSSTIDLAREVSESEIVKAEDDANRIVWEDRPVAIRFASAEEAAAMGMRKESARSGTLRLIDVQEYDLSACGGTHVERTGAIGIVAIGSVEKFKGGSRVEFLCGGRALQRFRTWKGALSAMQKHLSVAPIEMAASIERMQEDAKSAQRNIRGFQEKLATHEARALLAKGATVIEAIDGWDAQGIKAIAAAITAADPNAVVVLFTTATPAQVVIARGASSTIDAGAVLKKLAATFGGKGGGKADLAQGGGLNAASSDLLSTARQMLASQQ